MAHSAGRVLIPAPPSQQGMLLHPRTLGSYDGARSGGLPHTRVCFPGATSAFLALCSCSCPCPCMCSARRALLARPASLGRGFVTAAPLRRCLLASTCRTLQCRYRRSTTPPRTHGAWNAAAVSLAGLGRGAPSTTVRARFPPASYRRPSPLVAGTCLFFLSFLPARPPLSGTGVSASGCIAPRLAVARCTPRPSAASNKSVAASMFFTRG